MNVLVVDVGGSHVKILATGQSEPRKFDSGPTLTAQRMVQGVKKLAQGWNYEVVTIGCAKGACLEVNCNMDLGLSVCGTPGSRFIDYPGAVHAFTNPEATEKGKQFNLPLAYNPEADKKSKAEADKLFASAFKQ